MSLIFCGDVAVPFGVDVDLSAIRSIFDGNHAVVNFEGAMLFDEAEREARRWTDKYSLFNTPATVSLLKELNAKVLSLLNNHTKDFRFPTSRTVDYLTDQGFSVIGRDNYDECRATLDGHDYIFITFATYGCAHNYPLLGVGRLVSHVRQLRAENPGARIVIFPHWGLEMMPLPEPADRHLGRRLIDAGADIIVGHHPHVVQPVERYNGKYIIYSIGNFMMPNAQVAGMKYTPRPETQNLMVVEWDGGEPKFHHLHFDADTCRFSLCPGQETEQLGADDEGRRYFKKYVSRTGWSHYLRFARYSDTTFGERGRWLRMRAYYLFRRLLIKTHIYRPY